MTLKEQTIKRIAQQKEKIKEHKKEYGRVSLYDKLELKYLESVLKDLEVLEILKTILKKSTQFNGCISIDNEINSVRATSFLTKTEYEKIKEWLEDGNNNK